MSQTPTPHSGEAASAGAILWTRSMQERVAPDALGGQTLDEQERIVRENAHEDGHTLGRILIAVGPDAGTEDDRLQAMIRMLKEQPIRHVYVPGAVYADDEEDDIMTHHYVLMHHGTRLTICEDE